MLYSHVEPLNEFCERINQVAKERLDIPIVSLVSLLCNSKGANSRQNDKLYFPLTTTTHKMGKYI